MSTMSDESSKSAAAKAMSDESSKSAAAKDEVVEKESIGEIDKKNDDNKKEFKKENNVKEESVACIETCVEGCIMETIIR